MTLLRHATECNPCANALRQATHLYSDEISTEEETLLGRLSTSSARGQRQLAKRLLRSQHNTQSRRLFDFRSWWAWGAGGLATAALCCLVWVAVVKLRPPSDDRLLAEAYSKHRTTELRIPGGASVDLVSPTRGSTQSDLDPAALLQLKLRAQQKFQSQPNDPALRQTLGRIALVQHDGETALRHLEMARVLNPKLPSIDFDLASAHFEIAEGENRPIEYTSAIDLYSQYLEQHPNDSVALFNRGLCWERQAVAQQAIKDFQAALASEKDAAWRAEIQRHLDTLQAAGKKAQAARPLTPEALLHERNPTDAAFESFLDRAVSKWLPQRSSPTVDPDVNAALQRLAALGNEHGDSWLADLLALPASDAEHAAEQQLVNAINSNRSGNFDDAQGLATAAGEAFLRLNNRAGYLRASFEQIYALQREGRTKECLARTTSFAHDPALARFSWLRIANGLESCSCHGMSGDLTHASSEAAAALEESRRLHLPLMSLQAATFELTDETALGHTQRVWQTAIPTLATANAIPGNPMRRFQLLNNLETVADQLQLRWTKAGLSAAAADAAAAAGDATVAAYAYEDLALAETEIHQLDAAQRNFQAADLALAKVPAGPAASLFRADWQADRAELLERQSGAETALNSLGVHETNLKDLNMVLPRVHFYTEYAELLRGAGKLDESMDRATQALAISASTLPNLHSDTERKAWQQQARRTTGILILDLADLNRPLPALQAWEWLQSSPTSRRQLNLSPLAHDVSAPTRGPHQAASPGRITLVYAQIGDRTLAWLVDGSTNSVQLHTISTSSVPLEQRVDAFARLCADPNSDRRDLALLGSMLSRDLLQPFEQEIRQASSVQLDVDDSLSRLPFAALPFGSGYLGTTRALSYVQRISPTAKEGLAKDQTQLPASAHIVIVRGTATETRESLPDQYDESLDLVREFPSARLQRASFGRNGESLALSGSPGLQDLLRNADIVHYSGHGLDETSAPDASHNDHGSDVLVTQGLLPHCRLAVLAACSTLRKREDGLDDVPSFTRALLSAGASHVLATQWDIDSRTTRTMMLTFYSDLQRHEDFAEALRRSMQTAQSNPASSHPYFWASFQLINNSGTTLLPGS